MAEIDNSLPVFQTSEDEEANLVSMSDDGLVADPNPDTPDEAQAAYMTGKVVFGYSSQPVNQQAIYDGILDGREEFAQREREATSYDAEMATVKGNLVSDFVSQKARSGEDVTPDDILYINNLTRESFSNPKAIREKLYGRAVVNQTLTTASNSKMDEAIETEGDDALAHMSGIANYIATREVASRKAQDFENRWKKESTASVVMNSAATMFPFVDYYNQVNAVDGSLADSWLLGNNKEEQYQSLYLMDPDTAASRIDQISEAMYADNPVSARSWINGLVAYGASQRAMDNFNSYNDVSIFAPGIGIPSLAATRAAGRGVAAVGRGTAYVATKATSTALKGSLEAIAKATGRPVVRPSEVLDAVGDTPGAAVQKVLDDSVAGPLDTDFAGQLYMRAPMISNLPGVVQGGSASKSAVFLNNLVTKLEKMQTALLGSVVNDTIPIERLTNPATRQAALDQTTDILHAEHSIAAGGVVDVELIPQGQSGLVDSPLARFTVGQNGAAPTTTTITAPKRGATTNRSRKALGANKGGFIPASAPVASAGGKPRIKLKAAGGSAGDAIDTPTLERPNVGETVFIRDAQGDVPYRYAGEDETTGLAMIDAGLKDPFKVPFESFFLKREPVPPVKETLKKGPKPHIKLKSTATTTVARKAGDPFDSEIAAARAAREDYGFSNFKTFQQGDGWFIQVIKPIDETAGRTRDALRIETKNTTPDNFQSAVLKYLLSPTLTMPREIHEAMTAGAVGSGKVIRAVQEFAKDMGRLSRKEGKRMNEFLHWERTQIDPVSKELGTTSSTVAEFEQRWFDLNKVMPNDKETQFYVASKALYDDEWVANNLGVVRDKYRIGLQNYEFNITSADGVVVNSPKIEGKFITDFPPEDVVRDAGIYVIDPVAGKHYRYKFTSIDDLNKLKKDYKIIHITDQGYASLKGMPGIGEDVAKDFVHFVLVKNFKSGPLDFVQVPRRAGIHYEYKGFFVSQPSITKTTGRVVKSYLRGDVNAFHAQTEGQAARIAATSEEIRVRFNALRAEKDPGAAKLLKTQLNEFIQKNSPLKFKEWEDKFYGENAVFDPEMSFGHRAANQTMHEKYNYRTMKDGDNYRYPNLIESKDDTLNLYSGAVNLKFATERNSPLLTWNRQGSASNPVWNLSPAKMINPLDTLGRVTQSLMRDRYMGDWKIKSAEHFIAEFGHLLDPGFLRAFDHNPFETMVNPQWIANAERSEMYQNAVKYSQTAREFLNYKSDFQKGFEYRRQKLANSIQERYGDKAFNTFDDWTDPSSRLMAPVEFMKKLAYHTKLGMFNPIQLWKQSQTLAHVSGILGPTSAMEAMGHGWLLRNYVRATTESQLDHVANLATKWGDKTKADHFHEMAESYRKYGYNQVNRAQAVLDTLDDARIVQSRFGQFADAGLIFYNAGEELVRQTAYAGAYNEWRRANPIAKFDNVASQKVLARAQLLGGDMIASANASWQKGVFAIPTQFTAYQIRIMEQVWGNRLTGVEKARLFSTYATLYGVPVAASVGIGLWPVHESTRREMLDRGWNADNIAIQAFHDGLLQTIASGVMGEKYNFAEAYGPNGLSQLKDLIQGDKSTLEVLSGVSGSSSFGFIASSEPFLWALLGSISGKQEGLELTQADVMDFLSNVSTVSAARKAYNAAMLGKYISRNQVAVTSVDGWDGFMMSVMGVQPVEINTMYDQIALNKAKDEYQREAEKRANKYYQLSYRAQDPEDNIRYLKKAKLELVAAGIDPIKSGEIMRRSFKGYEDMAIKVNYKFSQQSSARMNEAARKSIRNGN